MDRGRVGFNAIGNKCIRENMVSVDVLVQMGWVMTKDIVCFL
jgi:hypothetical protein